VQSAATTDTPGIGAAGLTAKVSSAVCAHCGAPCRGRAVQAGGRDFCCRGCLTVFELLAENGLSDFYQLAEQPGIRVRDVVAAERFAFLDEPTVRDRILDFADEQTARVTLQLPAIHCVACVWLLENLFKLHPGVGRSVVDFERREASIVFAPDKIRLSELAALLTSIGYEPTLRLDSVEAPRSTSRNQRSLFLKLGVAGFAFGNIMLLSICLYAGMDRFSAPVFQPLFGWVSLVLAVPVLVYSASDYWRGAWLGLRQRTLNLDFPIALGLAALFGQSLAEIAAGRGTGYLDSFAGLVFFLLIGRVFQDRTYRRLSFDRDYRAFFPLAVRRLEEGGERLVALSELAVGDRLRLRHGELIPADSRVVEGSALIDYSFVTGESEAVERGVGDVLYAGGQQVGGAIDLEILKPVSQSYLTSLWSHETFSKPRDASLNTLLNRFSRVFTFAVITLALAAGAWWWSEDVSRAIRAFTSVLIVACPCALALSAPFALGTAQRLLGRLQVFVRNAGVLETLAGIKAIVFDKTGTLTAGKNGTFSHSGNPLSEQEMQWVKSVASRSTHPHSRQIVEALTEHEMLAVGGFREMPGQGVEGQVAGHTLRLGSGPWVDQDSEGARRGAELRPSGDADSQVHVSIDGSWRGTFCLQGSLRPGIRSLMSALNDSHELVLLSGDQDRQRNTFAELLGPKAELQFGQSPAEKRAAIESLQNKGHSVMMVGDGLNDAGALRQSDVGVAVVESVGRFSPASDIILEARQVPGLAAVLRFARSTVSIVWASILLSLLYNVVGLSFAATGRLSPLICAVLMPLSSISVVTFASLGVTWMGCRSGLLTELNQESIV
jgi:Cu+-exporting ATPase